MATHPLCQSIPEHQCNTCYPRMLQHIMATHPVGQSIPCNTGYPKMLQCIMATHPVGQSISEYQCNTGYPRILLGIQAIMSE